MKKRLIIVFLVLIIILLGIIITTKIVYLNKYNEILNDEYFKEILSNLNNKNNIDIKKNNNVDDYLIENNIKIRNDFKKFNKLDSNFYVNEDKKTAISFFEDYTFTDILTFKKEAFSLDANIDIKKIEIDNNMVKYLKKININNDYDYFNYLSKEHKLSIFDSLYKIIKTYNIYLISQIMLPNISKITYINGDYNGIITNNGISVKEVFLYKNNKRYIVTFINSDYFTNEYVYELISTIELKND